MRGLVFLAHGSRREKSNLEVRQLAESIESKIAASFDLVEAAFLELVPPTLDDAIEGMLARGAKSITIYPFFLNSGKHVDKDIPVVVDRFRAAYPDREFIVCRHFGALDAVPDLIADQLND